MYKNELFGDTAWMETLECALKVMKFVARVYVNGEGGPSLGMINKELKINTGKLRIVLQELVDLHILVEAKEEDDYFYYPAFDSHTMSVGDIIIRFSRWMKVGMRFGKTIQGNRVVRFCRRSVDCGFWDSAITGMRCVLKSRFFLVYLVKLLYIVEQIEMKYEEKNRFRVHFLIVGNNIVLPSKFCSRFGGVVFR